MSSVNLQRIIEHVQNHSGSSVDLKEWRGILCQIFNSYLADPKKVSEASQGQTDIASAPLVILQCTLQNAPQLFVCTAGTQPGPETADERKCNVFTSWVVCQLLRLLSHQLCAQLSQSVRDLLTSLLVVIKSKAPYSFHRHVAELIGTLAELTQKENEMYTEGQPKVTTLTLYDLPEGERSEVAADTPHRPVEVNDLETCYRLQANITQLLTSVALELCQYAADLVSYVSNDDSPTLLWATVSCQLEYGEVLVKTVSVQLLTQLLRGCGLPGAQLLDYYVSCVVSLVALLATGFSECDGDYCALEAALSANLSALLCACLRPDMSAPSVQLVYERLGLELTQCVIDHGVGKLRTDGLKHALCHTTTEVFQRLQDLGWLNPILQEKRAEMVCRLIAELGQSTDAQFMVEFLVAADLQEKPRLDKTTTEVTNRVCPTTSDAEKGPSSSQESSTSAASIKERKQRLSTKSPVRKRKIEDGEQEEVKQTPTQRQLLSRLTALCDTLQHAQSALVCERSLEGARVVLEVLAWSRICGEHSRQADGGPPVPPPAVAHVTRTLQQLLLELGRDRQSAAGPLYRGVARCVGSLLQATDPSSLEPATQQFLVCTLSLPWLLSEMSWNDLKPANTKEVTAVATAIADKIDAPSQALCVYLLSIIPKDVVPMWRGHLIKLAVGSEEAEVRAAAVRSFPVYLHHSGPNANHLVHKVIHPMLKDRSELVHQALARAVGPLACVISRRAVLERTHDGLPGQVLSYDSLCVKCACSDGGDKDASDAEDNARDRKKVVDPKMFVPFLDDLSDEPVAVKLDLIASLPRLFGHIGIRASNANTLKMVNQCMSLLLDPDRAVRLAFSEVVHHLVSRVDEESHTEMDRVLLRHVSKATKYAKVPDNTSVLETVLVTVGRIARVAEEHLLLMCMLMLVDQVCCKQTSLAWAVAHQQIQEVAQHRKLMTRQFMMQHAKNVMKVVVDHMHDAQSGRIEREPLDIIKDMAKVFDFESPSYFLERSEYMLLPHLMRKANSAASALLRIIARQRGDPNHKGPLSRNIHHIYSHLVCSCEGEELKRTLTFLEREVEWNLGNILKCRPNIDFDLLLHLATETDKVLTGLKILMINLDQCQEPVTAITNNTIADILEPRLLGILVHFDNFLHNGTNSIKEKQRAYRSLIPLMQLMGTRHITAVRVRLMTTLKIGLNYKNAGFPELCCRAWDCFIHILDVTCIGSLLSQIAVNLLPLVSSLPKQTAAILEYLIVDNRSLLSSHFHKLYFLPDIPEFAQINTVLKTYTEGAYKSEGLKTHIEHLLKGVTHESVDVRQLALSKLRNLLRTNQLALHRMVLGTETVDPIISQIVSILLSGCREPDKLMRSLYGECLGELGAIDPSRLSLVSACPKEELTRFHSTVTDENFAFDVTNVLAKAFLRAEEQTGQDSVSYAIQELIQLFDLTSDQESVTSGARLWRRFDDDVQEILMPLQTSKYMLTKKYDWSNLQKPIYRSKMGTNFEKWVSTLTGYLGSKVTQDKAACVFEKCRAVIKTTSQVALYMLPHVVVHVLLEDDEENRGEIVKEILAVLTHVTEPDTRHGSASDLRHMSAQTVFSVLDHLTKWLRHRTLVLTTMAQQGRSRQPALSPDHIKNDGCYQSISVFLAQIPQDLLARASYNCGAFSRALMHFEQYMKSLGTANAHTQANLDFLQKLYIALHESDGVTGITAIETSAPTLEEQIKAYESTGQLSDASVCYDRAIQLDSDNLGYRQGLLGCRLALGELNSAMDLANGIITERKSWGPQLNAYRVEAAWKLGQWDKLNTYLQKESKFHEWNVGLGKLLLAARNKNEVEVNSQLRLLRVQQMAPLSAASMEAGSYQRGYDYIVRLQMLNELETGMRTLLHFNLPQESSASPYTSQKGEPPVAPDLATLTQYWQSRLQIIQASYRTQEPILHLRRIMLGLARQRSQLDVDRDVGQSWLHTARIARESGLIQTAHMSLLSASSYNLPELCLENAQWLWDRGDYDRAQSCLQQAIEDHYGDRGRWRVDDADKSTEHRLTCAKLLLLLGRYCEETAFRESNDIMKQYKEVSRVASDWEDGYFYSAKYYDKIMVQLIEPDRPEKKGQFICQVVQNFGLSLRHGSQFIYQSMPRMLSLWLDYGSEVVEVNTRAPARGDTQLAAQQQTMRATLASLNKCMESFCERLAPFQFLTAFPQLISRICHTHPDIFTRLKEIIAKLLVAFPQQAVWMMMAVSKSSYQMRVKRCLDIFACAKQMNTDLNKFLQDATKLTDRLLDLCNRNVDTGQGCNTLSIAQHFKPLQRLIDDKHFCPIMLPLESLMTPTLPSPAVTPGSHDPFPGTQVYIKGIDDTVEVLPSLQKPKKITLKGSDGKRYLMLCKPKDDLRKDARLMEFNGIVNKCLRKDPESRRRNLHIRTYTVTPLNEECGLLEWVPNTEGLRHIIMKLYKERGIYTTGRELKAMQLPPNAKVEAKLDIYQNKLLQKHPALFSQWFLQTFPDPTSWYNARLAYSRTVATMSMVGYILGLGDRHGENILLDSTTGACVHVDFNCLFNKGETFDYPEIVPFRLTHNMVEAMGPMGYEGIFRRACEATLRVMRNEMDPLMSVLRTFIYDPLVEWNKPARGRSNPSESGEIKNEKAKTHITNIEERLRGVLKRKMKARGLPLSVEGQVHHLIKEATDVENLCKMYIGWAAYM